MTRLQFIWDKFWFKLLMFSSNRISDKGKTAIAFAIKKQEAQNEHQVIH